MVIEGDMDFSKLDGLIPAVVQDRTSGEVLMVGFMNDAAWRITLDTGYVTFFSAKFADEVGMGADVDLPGLQVVMSNEDCVTPLPD